jgi:hypothetical protein
MTLMPYKLDHHDPLTRSFSLQLRYHELGAATSLAGNYAGPTTLAGLDEKGLTRRGQAPDEACLARPHVCAIDTSYSATFAIFGRSCRRTADAADRPLRARAHGRRCPRA